LGTKEKTLMRVEMGKRGGEEVKRKTALLKKGRGASATGNREREGILYLARHRGKRGGVCWFFKEEHSNSKED